MEYGSTGYLLSHFLKNTNKDFKIVFLLHFYHKWFKYIYTKIYNMYLEKEMATHSSILAWSIPWIGEPDGLQSMGSQRVGHD